MDIGVVIKKCNCSEPTSKMLRISSVWQANNIKIVIINGSARNGYGMLVEL